MNTLRYFFLAIASLMILNAVDVKKVQAGDIEMAYYLRGNGPPLIMINGFRGTMAKWDPAFLESLEKHFTLILFDNRGVGLSSDTQEDQTTIQQMADDTANLLNALNYHSVYVLGWSMGSRIAQQLTIRHPELVRKLILCAPNAGGIHQIATPPDVLKKLISGEDDAALFFTNKEAAFAMQKRIEEAVAKGSIPNDFSVSQQTTERESRARGVLWARSNDNFEALAKITVPVLVADGREDIINPPMNASIVANQIPFAWLAFFDGGHAFLFQDTERFANLVTLFLKR